MKRLFLNIAVAALCLFPGLSHALQNDDILGGWVTADRDCRVEIVKKGDHYFGLIAALKEPDYLPGEIAGMEGKPRLDSENLDESLRSRPLVGIELMANFRFEKNRWVGGSIYDPKNGKTYNCEISLAEDGTLHVRGYVGVSLFGRTTIWEPAGVYLKKELSFLGLKKCSCN